MNTQPTTPNTKFVVVTSSEHGTCVSRPLSETDATAELNIRKSSHSYGAWHELMDLRTAANCLLIDPSLAN